MYAESTDDATGSVLLLVMDGHGEFGHKVSGFLKTLFPKTLFAEPAFATDVPTALREVSDRRCCRFCCRSVDVVPLCEYRDARRRPRRRSSGARGGNQADARGEETRAFNGRALFSCGASFCSAGRAP